MSQEPPITYRDAGVDIDAASEALSRVKALIEETHGPDVLSGIGSFGGLFRAPGEGFSEPVLVASTDGVGTKIKVAVAAGRHDTVGQDLVNHCVNDILVQGARPLFFLDYVGTGKVAPDTVATIIGGVARACRENGCALLGGETAEMPDVYSDGEYDLVGTIIGVVDHHRILDGSAVRVGDRLIGLESTGLHTNGYSLARKILLDREGFGVDSRVPGLDGTVGEVLLRVHRSYLKEIMPLLDDGLVSAMAHITGGGLVDNLPRVLPAGTAASIDTGSWEVPPIFQVLRRLGPVTRAECFRAFNMGVGMVLIVAEKHLEDAMRRLGESGARPTLIGEIVEGDRTVELL